MNRASFYGLALLIVLVDQATKAWLVATVPLRWSMALWPGVFHITHTQNTGGAFSLLQGSTPLLAASALVVIGAIIWAERRSGGHLQRLAAFSLALPLGGALGNLTDRVRQGYVTDMFDFRLINFPVFNIADMAITVGIALILWRTLTGRDESERCEQRSAPEATAAETH